MVTKKREGKKLADAISYRAFFETEDGLKIIYDLMRHCHMLDTTFAKDPHEMYLREGMRNVALYILAKTNTDIPSLKQMIESRTKTEKEYDLE